MIAARTRRKSTSVPLSPVNTTPSSTPKNVFMSSRAVAMMLTSSREAGLSRPWLSGMADSAVFTFTTDFRVSEPPAFSKKIRGPW